MKAAEAREKAKAIRADRVAKYLAIAMEAIDAAVGRGYFATEVDLSACPDVADSICTELKGQGYQVEDVGTGVRRPLMGSPDHRIKVFWT